VSVDVLARYVQCFLNHILISFGGIV
jgi:hypothetical protein